MINKILCFFKHSWVIYHTAVWRIPRSIKKCSRCGIERNFYE